MDDVLEEAKKVLMEILSDFKKNQEGIGKKLTEAYIKHKRSLKTLGKCPKCGKDLVIVVSRRSGKRFVGCTGYKDGCDFAMPLPQFGMIVPLNKECPECGMPMIMVRRKGKRPFSMCININCPTKDKWRKKQKQ